MIRSTTLQFLVYTIFSTFHVTFAQTCSASQPCSTPACCSKFGNCGFGPDFCNATNCVRDCDKKSECGQFGEKADCPLKVCCSQFGFCGTTADFCGTGCQNNCASPTRGGCSGTGGVKLGYYASWARSRKCHPYSAKNINPRTYTHLNYAFGIIQGGLMIPFSGDEDAELREFVKLKSFNPSLKTLISVGGWVFNDPGPTRQEFHNIISTPDSRARFISSVESYLNTYNLDGIDIDYEYPAAPDRGGVPEDTDNYLLLVQEMRAAFGSRFVITIAAPASYWYLRHFKIGEMSRHLDFINVMTYDIHGVWDADIPSLGPFVKSHTDIREVGEGLDLFLRDGVPADKLVLGLGYYGRSFTLANPSCSEVGCTFSGPADPGPCTENPGTLALFEIKDLISKTSASPRFDAASMSKILVYNTNQWIAYDDEETLKMREDYAAQNCLKGTMIWSIDQGADQTVRAEFMRDGSLNINQVELTIWFIAALADRLRRIRLDVDSTYHFTGDEVAANSVSVVSRETNAESGGNGDTSTCSAMFQATTAVLPTATGVCTAPGQGLPPTRPPGPSPTTEFWDTIRQVLQQDESIQLIPIMNPTGDPIHTALARPIQGGLRLEYVQATIFPRHLGRPRTDFTQSDRNYMRNVLQAISGDEAGHMVASSLGGLPQRHNLAPQSSFVNRDAGGRSVTISWFNAEQNAREFLNEERQAGRDNSFISWTIALYYQDLNSGRPTRFSLRAQFFRGGVELREREVVIYDLCNGPPGTLSCPSKKRKRD